MRLTLASVFGRKQLVNRRLRQTPELICQSSLETPLEWNRIGSYALRSNYIRSFRTPKCLFFSWALECKFHCPLEAREKKLAHRDLLMGLRWSWIRCTFLDTIGYLGITERMRRQRAQSLSEHKDQLTGVVGKHTFVCPSVCLSGCCTWCRNLRDLPRWPQAEQSVNLILRLHTAPVCGCQVTPPGQVAWHSFS